MGKCVPLEQQPGFRKAEAGAAAPPSAGALDPHSGRRFGGVEAIEGGNQNAPKKAPAPEKK